MNRSLPSRRRSASIARHRIVRPIVEGLEHRCLLSAASGDRWVYPQRVTYSFIPDGTNVGGISSSLYSTMKSAGATATWQLQFQKAAAIWETVANIQLVQVSDNGTAVGQSGKQQGDSNFGDIRIGAIPEQSGTLGLTFFPPPDNGGTLAGDMFFNSSVNWQINSGYDIETVALHEFGHALGMAHSQIQQALLYASYNGIKQTTNSDDVSGLSGIYGPVPSDTTSNGQVSTATDISGQINANGQVTLGGQEIVAASNLNFYKITVPASTTGTMTVSVQASSLSSLAPRVTLYNASGQGLVQTSNTNLYSTTAAVTLSNVNPGEVYYIKASSANAGAGSIGTYGLLVNFGNKTQAAVAPPNTSVTSQTNTTTGTSNSETTDGGGVLGGLLGGLLDTLGGVVDGLVHIGSLTGAGDALTVTPAYARHHHLKFPKRTHPFRHAVHTLGQPHPHGNLHKPNLHAHPAVHLTPRHHGLH